jgi:hypothetical protein
MCCLFASLLLLGPRAVIFLWWLFQPVRWSATFDSFILPFLGFLFLPWTTLMYVLVFPGGLDTFDWIWLALAFAVDISSWMSGGVTGRRRYYSSGTVY